MKTENTIATKNVIDSTGLKVRTNVTAGRALSNHSQTVARGLLIKCGVKAGGWSNHNQTVVVESRGGLRVKSSLQAGHLVIGNHNQTVARGLRVKRTSGLAV